MNTELINKAAMENSSRYNRPEIEQVALGCLMISTTFDLNPFDLTLDDFTTITHRDVFAFICAYFKENGCNPDMVTAWSHFKAQEKKYHVQLCEMIDVAVTPSLYPQYCTQLRRMTIERKTAELYWHWQGGRLDFEEYQEKIKGLDLAGKPVHPWQETLKDFSEALSGVRPKPKIYLTPFKTFNEKTGGFITGDFILISARPGIGKTGIMCNMAIDSAKREYSVAFLSLEMSTFSILSRFFGSELGIDTRSFRLSNLNASQQGSVAQTVLDWADFKIFVEDRRIAQFRDIERIIRENKPEVVFLDYIQLLHTGRHENRNSELDFISNRLKEIARIHRCVVVAGCQLSRKAEGKDNAELSDLRDSGSLEQAADMVIMLNPRDDNQKESIVQLDVKKSRNTGRFRTTVRYQKRYQRFDEIGEDKS